REWTVCSFSGSEEQAARAWRKTSGEKADRGRDMFHVNSDSGAEPTVSRETSTRPPPRQRLPGADGDPLEVPFAVALGRHPGIVGQGHVDHPAVGRVHRLQSPRASPPPDLLGDPLLQGAELLLADLVEAVAVDPAEDTLPYLGSDHPREQVLDRPQQLALVVEAALGVPARELDLQPFLALVDAGREVEAGNAEKEVEPFSRRVCRGTGRRGEPLGGRPRPLGQRHQPFLLAGREPGAFHFARRRRRARRPLPTPVVASMIPSPGAAVT